MTTHKLGSAWAGVSLSHGTLREEDLIPRFEAVLATLEDSAVAYLLDRPFVVDKLLGSEQALTAEDWELVSCYLNETLFELLNDVAPDGCYFGAHPGDGSDYGFWPCHDEDESAPSA
jgi:hypothetical protein